MVAAQQIESDGYEDIERAEEEELARQELALQALEVEAHNKQRLMAARVVAVEAERANLKKTLQELASAGAADADAMIKALPRLPLIPATPDRKAALEARREAIRRREQALHKGNRERDALMEGLAKMRGVLEEARVTVEHVKQRHDEKKVRPIAAPPPPRAAPPPPAAPRKPAPTVVDRGPARRAMPRTRLDCEVGMETETNFFAGFAWDISSGGLFVTSFEPMQIGQEVDLMFTLPDGTKVDAVAQVRWTRDHDGSDTSILPGVGLQFVRISDDARAAIDRFVNQREPMFFPG